MPVEQSQLLNEQTDYPLGQMSRLFFEADELLFQRTKRHAEWLNGLCIVDETWERPAGCSACWSLTFTFEGHTFQIATNHHAALSLFFVGHVNCPDSVLLRVLNHFNRIDPRSFAP